jgi:hypothetical protein
MLLNNNAEGYLIESLAKAKCLNKMSHRIKV